MTLDTKTIWALVAYVSAVGIVLVGILLSSSEGAGSPLVPIWLGFCGVSGGGLLSQRSTKAAIGELANGGMEPMVRQVVGTELAKYFANPKAYTAEIHENERQRDRMAALQRAG